MKKHLFILILLAFNSCKKINESYLNLNVDPLTEAYKKNNVEYYLRVVYWKDTIFTLDSVCINRNGLKTLEKVKKGWFSETKNEYDSLNRIIQAEHHSDIHYKSKTKYQLDTKSNNLIGYNFSYNTKSFNTTPNSIVLFKFKNGQLTEEILIDEESKDTIRKSQFKYNSKNKIYEISIKNLLDKYEVKTKYSYKSNNTLKEIIDYAEVKYISEKTGLIDSVKQRHPNEKITYKYYFVKKK